MFVMSTTPPKKEVNTNSEAKQTNILGNKEPLKTDKTKTLVTTPKKMIVRNPREN